MIKNKKPIQYFSKGIDQVEFLLSANPGEPLKPMASIASGGEMSRIMLAIKMNLKNKDLASSLVFDEIDSGISGKIAEKVGISIKTLSYNQQIICITHLSQIASQGEVHFKISKTDFAICSLF